MRAISSFASVVMIVGGGCAEFGEQVLAAGLGGVGVPVGVGPVDTPVGEQLVGPAGPERLQQVVFAA
jgi:hypothetical protein